MTTILGVDPGSRITGYGIIRIERNRAEYVDAGCIQLKDIPLSARLRLIFDQLSAVIRIHRPTEAAVEKVFMNRNADSALKLGQARGAAIVAAAALGLAVFEYSPNEIKQAIVGRGHADKVQVQHMVKALLGLAQTPPADAADALATAICHGHTQIGVSRLADAGEGR